MKLDYPEVVAEYGHLRRHTERTLRALKESVPDHKLFDVFGQYNIRTAEGHMAQQLNLLLKFLQLQGY